MVNVLRNILGKIKSRATAAQKAPPSSLSKSISRLGARIKSSDYAKFGLLQKPTPITLPNLMKIGAGVMPVGGAGSFGGGGLAGKAARSISSAGKAAYKEFTAPVNLASLKTKAGQVVLGTATAGTGLLLGEYAATGKFPKFSTRTIAGLSALRLAPFAALIGMFKGGGQEAIEQIKGMYEKAQDLPLPDFEIPQYPPIEWNFPDYSQQIRDLQEYVRNIQTPQLGYGGGVSGSYAPSVNIAPQVGGGMDLTPLLIALLGGAGAGYLLGRRKRKKKKYKKRKKH